MDGNLCPECGGIGYIEGECIFWGGQYEPPEYADVACPVCDGEGVITTPLAEDDAGRYVRVGAEVHPERGYEVITLSERWA